MLPSGLTSICKDVRRARLYGHSTSFVGRFITTDKGGVKETSSAEGLLNRVPSLNYPERPRLGLQCIGGTWVIRFRRPWLKKKVPLTQGFEIDRSIPLT